MSKAKDFPQSKIPNTRPLSPPPSSSSVETDRKKHCKNKQKSKTSEAKGLQAKSRHAFVNRSSNRYICAASSGHYSPIPDLLGNLRNKFVQQLLPLTMESIFPTLDTAMRHCSRAVKNRSYCLANHSTNYNETVSSYISEMVGKVKSQLMAHFLDSSNNISAIGFLTTFKLACDTNNSHEGAALCILSFVVKNAAPTTHNSRMSVAAHINPVSALVNTFGLQIQKDVSAIISKSRHCSFKNLSNDQGILKIDSKTLRENHLTHMTFMQYADYLYAKSCRNVNLYSELIVEIFPTRVSFHLSLKTSMKIELCTHKQSRPVLTLNFWCC